MRDNRPSGTALGIARATWFWSFDPRAATLATPRMAEISGWFLEEADGRPPSTSRWVRAVARISERIILPGISIHYLLRKRCIEDAARAAIGNGARQIVVLAGGFDTLACRLAAEFPGVQFVEIDHPATQRVKRAALEKHNAIPPNLRLEPVDLSKRSLDDVIGDPDFVIAEGLLMYLEEAAVRAMFGALRGRNSSVAFTFMEKREQTVAFSRRAWLIDRLLKLRGEPFRWGIAATDIASFLDSLGYEVIELVMPEELRKRYVAAEFDRTLPPPLGDIVCLAKPK